MHEAARTQLSKAQAALLESLPKQKDQGLDQLAKSNQGADEVESKLDEKEATDSQQALNIEVQAPIHVHPIQVEEESAPAQGDILCDMGNEQAISSTSTSTSTSTSDGSFALQWGDALRAWAQAARPLPIGRKQQKYATLDQASSKFDHPKGKTTIKEDEPAINRNKTKPTSLTAIIPQPLPSPAPSPSPGAPVGTERHEEKPLGDVQAEFIDNWLQQAEFQDPPEDASSLLSVSTLTLSPREGASKHFQKQEAGLCTDLSCKVCNIFTFTSQSEWENHIHSKRHLKKLQAIARSTHTEQCSEDTKVFQRPTQRRYVGENADVEEYVNHVITPELNSAVEALLTKLLEWQRRTRAIDPVNAKRKRRVVSGFREVEKFAKNGKAKLIIVAPNVGRLAVPVPETETETEIKTETKTERKAERKAETDPINHLLQAARQNSIPVVFALSRQRLGRLLGARRTASAFAVLDVSGGETLLSEVIRTHALSPFVTPNFR